MLCCHLVEHSKAARLRLDYVDRYSPSRRGDCADVSVDRREHIYNQKEEEARMSPNQPGPGAKVRNMYEYVGEMQARI
ncbi:hypothetical protein V8C40DRAFT_197761 [Trichoderma camerunense]